MATTTGKDLKAGDVVKIAGKWLTVTSEPTVPEIGGRTWQDAREAQFTDRAGRAGYRIYFADDVLPVREAGKPAAVPVEVFHQYMGAGRYEDVVLEVRFVKRTSQIPDREREGRWVKVDMGGYLVVRADNGRTLGWICEEHDATRRDGGPDHDKRTGWSVRITAGAFRGDSLDDEGDPLDEVPDHLYGGRWFDSEVNPGERYRGTSASVTGCRDRKEAATELVGLLYDRRATAVTGEPHYRVRKYDTWKRRQARGEV